MRGLPSKTWQVNAGWVAAANIAADLAAWTRLLGDCDDSGLRYAAPDMLRYQVRHLLGALIQRLPGLRLAVPEQDLKWIQAVLGRGTESLPVAF